MKKLVALLLVVLMLVGFTSCSEKPDLKYVTDKGTLVVGITDFEPMDYLKDGKWTGFDAELARLVGKELGVKVKFQEIDWSKKETELAAKTIDCIWNGLTWDEERAENMSLSDYYMINKQVVVVKKENAEKLNTVDALGSATIAAEAGSAGETLIKESISKATYIEKEGQKDVLTELIAGTVDAGVIDYIMANYLINKEGSNYSDLVILEDAVEAPDEYYSIAFRKGSDITPKVNEILKQFKEDGTIEKLAAKYGLENALVK